ncbi:F-actin-monooxygenase MICAL3 isoform X11 [Canis lupus baileyi]|uniref:F-actin-monooxygenase MICAL3 isoform X9 n=1 Tax=Canis lupus familiaris TaxID=9615 RepID=UPI000BAA112C|nr:F-actin-monooxygenase MICAL3 isoform X9 [Canis lupus familiaris]XP_025317355.3 F-actin-monooxygenase MICAL3 isoform X11 [Canis lupus dingo]XP_038295482.1 F-actin-monooxygenase MICAL3 isoform X9 [Canis lupus familiaris]XP_038432143.1 F-actin-monooxygenase MICAL3 isoform X9 [Canis lupus familiaris]|eukprot:XP_022266592.1 F-actin-methionine sulfoxide oxidase MICAL3 isoform X10 [Canis lupus familiaris]
MEDSKNETVNHAHVLFDRFVQATTCKGTLKAFQELCDHLELKPKDYRSFYHKLKSKLNYWKAKALWAKLDKRGSHKDYKKGKACTNTKCLIIGAGPCGLRTAIDLSLLGAKVVVIEKRDAFSRNNVLHLWPFTIHDLRGLGAKKFYGKFCAGAIDHISIRQLQLILLKVALILGIEIHVNVEFQGLVQPPEDQENERIGWRALVHPKTHPVSEYEFEVIIGGDGRRNTLEGFRRKEFRGKLAIAITANFINRNTTAEAKVEEISGVAFIFNQKFFQELKEATGIDLENIVYYKDDTHYFVMTAKKQSLLDKGVILHDYADTELLLSRENVDQEALLNYAREAADFSTQQQLPSLDFAINHYGQPDVAMFDFTCMYASENAALVREQNGHQLLVALVGDSLLEPFWPMGTGIARGFLAAMDSAWMVRSWSLGTSPLEVLAERESIYRLLPQTTPENVSKNFSQYSIDPVTRYPNININFLRPSQVRHLYNTGETRDIHLEMENLVNSRTTPKLTRNESVARSSKLLGWCQRQTDGYAGVNVTDLTMSWKSGLALCAIIHRYRPDLIDFDSLDEQNVEKNNQLAFDIAEKELGISPIMTGKEMASVGEPDKLSMVMYLTQFYEMFKDSLPSSDALDLNAEEKAVLIASTKSPISFLSKLGQTISRKRSPKDKKEKDLDGAGKRRKTSQSEEEEAPRGYRGGRPTLVSTLTDRRMDVALGNQNKVKYMATQLLAKFEENAPPQSTGMRRQPTQERGVSQPSCCLPEQGHPAPTPQWKQQQEKERSRTCPKKVITLSPPLTPPPCRAPRSQQTYRDLDADSRGKQSPHHERPEPEPSRRFFVDQWELSLSLRSSNRPASPSSDSLRQKYIKMYTGGVSSLAEQIANQLQRKEQPKTLLDKKELGSIKKEFPQNLGGSDTCYFCRKRVYVMERLSAEGKFFHRSCFKCEYCATTLRLSAYAYDIEDGKFYCKPHYCYRLSGSAQRKRPAVAPLSGKEAREPLQDGPTVDTNGRASAVTSPAERTPGSSVNGVEEPSIAKRLRGTPERIELENYRLSVKQAEELEEVPEETQAEHNLSSVLDTGAEEDVASSSSESEMEEEEEEEPPLPTSDLGGVPWKEAVRIHALLKGKSEEELEASKSFGPGHEEDEEEEEYEEEEEEEEEEYEEEEEEEESSEEGEYCPWDRELLQGQWLRQLSQEETTGTRKVGSQRLQQIVNPADPLEIQADVHWTHIREREEEERMVPTSESSTSRVPDLPSIRRAAVQAWLETVSGVPFDENDLEEDVDSEPAKIEGEATENGDTGDTGAELDDDQRWSDGIPSDAETDLRVQHQEAVEADLELRVSENEEEPPEVTPGHPERSLTRVPSPALSPEEQAGLRSPGHSPKAEGAQIPLVSVVTKAKLPEENLFPKPLLPKVKPKVEVPCSQRAACSPIRSQPVALPEARTPTSPVSSQCLSPLATSTPTSTQLPICSQPQPSSETTAPSPTKSPIRLQPVSAKTSIPVVPLPLKNQGDTKDRLGSPLAVDEALKRNDLVAEFWMKSAEIRRSLGLTPVDRSKVYEPSFPSPAFKPVSLKSYAVEKSPEGEGLQLLKPPPVPKRLGLPKSDGDQPFLPTPKSPSDRELKSSQEERRDLSSSSGLGLHGSSSNMKTLGSQSFNTSDSTMLTPPSSPPPPPPQDEEPATLRRKPYQTHEHKDAEPKASVIPPPPPATFMRAPREPTQPLQEEMRKSFVESVDEIPFADDVEDTYDDKTEDSSLQEKFFTPPSYWPRTERPLHPPLAKENGRLPTLESGVQPQKRGLPLVSPEAKELAEERMRAREKSVKSQALRDAMAKQLSKMKEMEMAAGTSSPPGGTSHKASSVPSKGKDLSPESPRRPVLKGPREPALKHEATSEEVLSPPSDSGGPDGSVTSSEGSSGKSKKRSSLFSPRRNKKEKKSKGEGRPPEKPSPSLLEEAAAKPKSLWKSVFSGYKKDKKKKGDDKSCSSTPSSGATVDSGKHKMSPVVRAELHLRRQLSFSEDSDLSSDDILERSSQKSRREPRTYTEEELNAKLTRRVQKAARRQAKQEELKRLHRAQIIQRQLEQVEEKQRQLEERGVAVEKALRGEAGMGKKDDPKLMQEWFKLVQEKNAMVRYESELMIFARELELEDRQSRLQQELRERMAVEDHLKTEEELSEEKKILNEMLEVVEQRDALVALLEEQRLREKEEDKDLEAVMLSKGFSLNWS